MFENGAVRAAAVVWTVMACVAVAACGEGRDDTASAAGSDDTANGSAAPVEYLPPAVQTVGIDADEYTFEIDGPDELRAGWTRLEFDNVGEEPHQVMFARIKDGVDMAELAAAGANDSSGAAAIEFVDMIGGVSYIDAGETTTALVDLTEGPVLAMCYVPDRNGVAHALLGMSTTLQVGPAPGAADAATGTDEVLGTIEFTPDGYVLPDAFETGWYGVENEDTALHELSLLQLERPLGDGEAAAVVEDLAANRVPSVELAAVGGMGAISPGFSGFLHLDLEDSAYLAVDFMPDPGEPRPHMLDGYWALFEV